MGSRSAMTVRTKRRSAMTGTWRRMRRPAFSTISHRKGVNTSKPRSPSSIYPGVLALRRLRSRSTYHFGFLLAGIVRFGVIFQILPKFIFEYKSSSYDKYSKEWE